jgi:hypothetical protein
MKALLTLLVAGALSGCVTTTYIDPYSGAQTQVVQPAPGVAETMALGAAVGALVAMDRSYTSRYPRHDYYRPKYSYRRSRH